MGSKDLNDLLDRLKLSDSDTVFFHENKDWYALIPMETKSKLDIIQPTAFYIFNRQPYILFFDLTLANYNKQREDEIHKQVWSFDQSPVIFIIKDADIEIYNAFSYEKKKNKLQKIDIKNNERDKQFSFWNLQSGNVWKWISNTYYKNQIKNKRVSQKLFENIRVVRENLIQKSNDDSLNEDEANTLILRLIFIRYLIDRNVKLDKEFIDGNNIDEKRLSFTGLIKEPPILNKLFGELNKKFNGVLFKDIKFQLSQEQANALAGVFGGETPEQGSLFEGFDFFFEIFDFSIIPVELISGIYESLIDPETRKLDSAVYTPPFLVEYMLTGTVDEYFRKEENKEKTGCKVFDPAVGSGIFLVQSYRRMVDRELVKDKKISKVRLREIAENNLFGIDINAQALKITCFSLYIAMLDYQEPKTILDNFHFPKLIDTNLFEANFFNTKHSFNEKIVSEKVDFILGNPPWKKDKSLEHLNWVNSTSTYSKKIKGKLEIAQSFLLHSQNFIQPQTIIALIVTSTIFYNVSTTTKEFKNVFLKQFCITNLFDLSAVKQSLFEQQESPALIVFFRLSEGKQYLTNVVKHQSIKVSFFLRYFKTLLIEKFDQKSIQQRHFIENDWMFKVALYGNTLDFIFLKKIEQIKYKLRDIIDEKNIFKGAGIERGKDNKPYPELINMPIIENSEIKEYYSPVRTKSVLTKNDINLSRGRKIDIFKGNKILLKEQSKDWNKPVISFTDTNCVFRKGTFSIASANEDVIKTIYSFLISNLYTYFLFNVTCAWGIGTRPAIRFDEEFLAFPYKKPNDSNKDRLNQLVNQFLSTFKEHYKEYHLGEPVKDEMAYEQINVIIEEIYQIKGYEKDLINYVLDISRYQFQESKQNKINRKIHDDKEAIEKYVDVFFNEFRGIYESEYLRVDIYPLDYFIALNFVFQEQKPTKRINFIDDVKDENEIFKALSNNITITEKAKDLYIQKDIKGFEDNSFYIIKPNEYKCWHRAIAWYDVAEVKEAIEAAEINYLKTDWNVS